MKLRKKILLTLLALLVLANAIIIFTGNTYIYTALVYMYANIDDYEKFENVPIKASNNPIPWNLSVDYNKTVPTELIHILEERETVAYLVVRDDSILYEQYWGGYGPAAKSNSFSMAKSYISALVGIAIEEGYIKSIDQPVGDFIPEFSEGDKGKITIKHLLTMCSGLNWDESYQGLFSKTTKGYYGHHLRELIYNLEPIEPPGTVFSYRSGDTQLLGFVLEAATGKSMNKYLEEKIWQPLGCEQDALWSVDREGGDEKAYCCINSNARDFARFGKLWLNDGQFNGQQIVPKDYVKTAIQPVNIPERNGYNVNYYGYKFWLIPAYKGHDIYYCQGHLGQFIICIPDENMVIIRLGHTKGEKIDNHYNITYALIDQTLTTFSK